MRSSISKLLSSVVMITLLSYSFGHSQVKSTSPSPQKSSIVLMATIMLLLIAIYARFW